MNGRTDLKISIITAVHNNADVITDCVTSVLRQTREVEHIIIDGASTDSTLEIVKRLAPSARIFSERDYGIYDALNKGIGMATGDVIGFLHADDVYAAENVIDKVARCMAENASDSCYGDLMYVDRKDTGRTSRYWRAGAYRSGSFELGWMPPHPTFFVRKKIYEQFGTFNTNFIIAADYELMLRFLVKHGITTTYLPEVLIKMRTGGSSNGSLRNLFVKTVEDYKAWPLNGLKRKWYTIPLKKLVKLQQFFRRGAWS